MPSRYATASAPHHSPNSFVYTTFHATIDLFHLWNIVMTSIAEYADIGATQEALAKLRFVAIRDSLPTVHAGKASHFTFDDLSRSGSAPPGITLLPVRMKHHQDA